MHQQLKLNKNTFAIIYKLLNDLLFISLVFFLITMLSEGLIPGIVTTHVGFSRIVLLVTIDILLIHIFSNKLENTLEISKNTTRLPVSWKNKKALLALSLSLFLLFFYGLLRIKLYISLPIIFLTMTIGYFIQKIIFEEI